MKLGSGWLPYGTLSRTSCIAVSLRSPGTPQVWDGFKGCSGGQGKINTDVNCLIVLNIPLQRRQTLLHLLAKLRAENQSVHQGSDRAKLHLKVQRLGEHGFPFANWVQREAVVGRPDRANVFDLISVMMTLLPASSTFLCIVEGACVIIPSSGHGLVTLRRSL